MFYQRICLLLWQPLTKIANSILSNLIRWESCEDHKRTQQGVSNGFLHYIYYLYMVHADDK